jgi:hypothetical protein
MIRCGNSVAAFILAAFCIMPSAQACPFCSAAPTLTQRIDESVTAYAFEWIAADLPDYDAGEPGRTRVQVRHIFKENQPPVGPGNSCSAAPQLPPNFVPLPAMKVGMLLDLPWYIAGERGAQYLLFGSLGEGTDLMWDAALPCPPVLLTYLQNRPDNSVPPLARLPYFIPFWEHANETIAVDAYSEFGKATYTDVFALKGLLDREKLLNWVTIEGPPTSGRIARRGFYGMLLGLCGTSEDAAAVEPILLTPAQDIRLGIDGMMAGYLMLNGETGLAKLEQHAFGPRVPDTEINSLLLAVNFLWDFAPQHLPRERMRQTVRRMLPDPRFTELAITTLTRWEDLSLVEALSQQFGEPGTGDADIQKVIMQYLIVMHELDAAGRPEAERLAIERAAEQLAALKALDPELYDRAARSLVAPTASLADEGAGS